jgi:DNA-directed RNA polymerase subunit RPC12/RpoP
MVFDPEYIDLDCPHCHLRRVYYDRDIGYYCMSCGRQFSTENILMLLAKAERTSQPVPQPDKSVKKPPAEIKELPISKAKKSRRAKREASEQDKSEHGSQR